MIFKTKSLIYCSIAFLQLQLSGLRIGKSLCTHLFDQHFSTTKSVDLIGKIFLYNYLVIFSVASLFSQFSLVLSLLEILIFHLVSVNPNFLCIFYFPRSVALGSNVHSCALEYSQLFYVLGCTIWLKVCWVVVHLLFWFLFSFHILFIARVACKLWAW